jgi:hypothetical protein
MHEPAFLLFASDATLVGLAGASSLVVAAIALLGERRRLRRKHIDAVGWMPWTTLSVLATFAGLSLLAMAAMGWLRG